MSDDKPIDKESVDLAQKLKQALLGSQKEMKELYSMGRLYATSIGDSEEIIKRSNFIRGQELGLVTALAKQSANNARTQKIAQDIAATTNDIIDSRNRTMADLLLKQTMMQTGLTDEHAEQAKNLALLLESGEITEGIYKMHVKRLQEDQKHVKHLKEELELQEAIADSILEIKEESEEWKKTFTKVFETAKAIGRDPSAMGALVMSEGIKKLEQAHQSFEEFREMGLSAGSAIEAQFKGLSLESMLGLSDTKGVMQGVVEEYGNVNALSSETVNDLGKMAHHLGISGQEAMKLNASLSQLPGETSETAANAMEHTAHLAEAQGIAGSKVFADMSKNTGAMALYSKGGAEAFGKTAVALHKMGVEIATAAKMADGLLNFEDSINKQMEASVLLGREINLDKARELALNGDLEGSTAEVLKNIGGSAEFEKMNVMQKKALAEATGMSVEELQKSIDAQEESNKYFGEGASLGARAAGTLMEYGGAAAGFFKENGMLLMSSIQFMSNFGLLQKAQNALSAMGNAIKNNGYLQDMAFWVKQKAQWAAEQAHAAWKKGAAALGFGGGAAKKGVEAAGEKLAGAGDAAKKVPAGAGKSTGGLTKAIEKINPGKLLAGAAALVLVAAAVFVFAKAAQEFMSVSWEAIGMAIVAMLALVGALALIGAIMMSGVGAVAILAGAGAMLIMAAALWVLGKAIQEIAKGFEIVGPVLVELAPMAMDIVALGAGLALMGYGMIALGLASWIAAPGLMLAAFGLNLMLPAAMALNALAESGGLIALGEAFMMIAASAPGLLGVAAAMGGIGLGLGLVALAGFAAIPVFGAMMALAAVAPMLASLGSMFGGGEESGGGKEDKMDKVVEKLDQLIAVASKGGEVKMDGKKVGEVIRLGLNTSNVR